MCQEGGCGACIVALARLDPRQNEQVTLAINSCLFPLIAVDGCSITTTEGLGNSRSGFHPIQERLAEHNGSQCGFCSPGMVMNMYSLLKENSKPTKQQIEQSFDGNICRCTGYRAILDAMQSFAVDENPIDIEESAMVCREDCQNCSHTSFCCKAREVTQAKMKTVGLVHNSSGVTRFKPSSIQNALALLNKYKDFGAQVVAGDTGKGVFKHEKQAPYLVDIMGIADLYIVTVKDQQEVDTKLICQCSVLSFRVMTLV
jgi:xanthine dehydrogenase/oxidase